MSSPQQESTIRITKYGLGIVAILLFAVFIRLYALDFMAFHHDESIHANYTYKLYKGDFEAYKYDPTYHGPFLYHYGALFFTLLGDTDFTARLPFVSFGLLLLYFVWRLKPYIGKTGTMMALLLVATSPTLTYFSRFARNDVYMAAMAMGILVFGMDYLRTRKNHYLAGMTFFLALMYSCKENSYMTGFMLGAFIVFYGIYYCFSYASGTRKKAVADIFTDRKPFVKLLSLYAIFSCVAFTLVYYVTRTSSFKEIATQQKNTLNADSYTIGVLQHAWNSYIAANGWVIPFWFTAGLAAILLSFFAFAWIGKKADSSPRPFSFQRFCKDNLIIIGCLLIVFFIYTFLFTTMGHNPGGMKAGVIDYLLYWMGQQDNPRIDGSPFYFIPRILIYEPATVLLAVSAFFIYTYAAFNLLTFIGFQVCFWATVGLYCRVVLLKGDVLSGLLVWGILVCVGLVFHIASIFVFPKPDALQTHDAPEDEQEADSWRPDGLRVFLIYWSVLSILIYAVLNEKVPWLMVHQVLPLVLLAGIFVGDIVTKLKSKNLVYTFMVLFSFLVVYEARTDIMLNIYYPDDPRESIVYTQSDHSVKHIVEEVEAGAKFLGDEYLPPYATKNLVAVHADGWWPYSWYLRKYKVSYINNMPPKDIPFVIIPTQFEDRMKLWAKGEYIKKKIKHRVWWPYGKDILPFTYFRGKNRPASEAWDALIRYTLYRELWGANDITMRPGSVNLLFYRKQPLVKPEETPAIPAGYEEPVRPLLTFATVGTFGIGEGQFNEPRGVALSPDESRVYVLDSRNGRIQVFDKDFKFITMFGRPGTGIGEFATPEIVNTGNGPNGGIAVGPDGTIYATDTWGGGSGRINRYKPDGTPMNPIMPPSGVQFFFPRGLAVSSTGLLYVADTGNNRILQFNANGAFMKILAENAIKEPVGLAAGANGKQYVCDVGSQRVIAFDSSGNYMAHWPVWGWKASEHELPWIEPYVAVDNQGNVYITDSTTNTVHKLSPDGKTAVQAGGSGSTRNQLNKPKGIAVAADGTLFVADSLNHRVIKARMPK